MGILWAQGFWRSGRREAGRRNAMPRQTTVPHPTKVALRRVNSVDLVAQVPPAGRSGGHEISTFVSNPEKPSARPSLVIITHAAGHAGGVGFSLRRDFADERLGGKHQAGD